MLVRWILLALCMAAFGAHAAEAETRLYATAIRVHYEEGDPRFECNLYRVDPATGISSLLAPVRIDGRDPIAVISLAIHPATGVVYGVTAGISASRARSLVTIDPASGDVSVIGPLGEVASDIGFSHEGGLYAWLPARNQLARVDLATGHATPLGRSGISGVMGGGMAIDDHDVAYLAATGATGTLDTIDIATGAGTPGPALQGAPYISAITNLTLGPDGRLYAVNSNMGSPANTSLVTIDPQSGKVTQVGRLPNDAHALIFAPEAARSPETYILGGGVALIAVLALVLYAVGRRRH